MRSTVSVRKGSSLEVCVFCEGTNYRSKRFCAWVRANAHCTCCREAFGGEGKTPCVYDPTDPECKRLREV